MIYLLFAMLFSPLVILVTLLRRHGHSNRILVIQTAKIGDLICATPLLREIKSRYPDSYLSVMVTPITAPILEYNPYVDDLILVTRNNFTGFIGKLRLARILRDHRFDAAVVLNPNLVFAFVTFLGCIPSRLSLLPDKSGLTYRMASRLFTHLEPHKTGTLVLDAQMALLHGIDINPDSLKKEVYCTEAGEVKAGKLFDSLSGTIVGVGVSSGNKLKELGTDKIAELTALFLNKADNTIILVGTAADSEAALTIIAALSNPSNVIDATGRFTLAELPALIKRFSLYVGVDSGITYMADALSVPLVNITGPADIGEQRPMGKKVTNLQEPLACVPCSHIYQSPYICREGSRACITTVSVPMIYEAAESLLATNTSSNKSVD